MNYYTGIGSRKTPSTVLEKMMDIAKNLAFHGWTLRSGHADGADKAFELGAGLYPKEIYLPWAGFGGSDSEFHLGNFIEVIQQQAMDLAAEFHPAWNRCSRGARLLHTRNVFQILGQDLATRSKFVICWSPGSGGTEQALRIAAHYNVPVLNLYDDDPPIEQILADAQELRDPIRIFVFGSNTSGRHGKGAALTARNQHGAEYGVAEGRTGDAYALPTCDDRFRSMPLVWIQEHVDQFLAYAKAHPELTFQVTRVGCGLAHNQDSVIAPMFEHAPSNCYFDTAWAPWLKQHKNFWGTFP